MGLRAWDKDSDLYSHVDLTANANRIDAHDHSPGKGAPLSLDSLPLLNSSKLGVCSVDTPQICPQAVTQPKLAEPAVKGNNIFADSVTGSHIVAGAVDTIELADGAVEEAKLDTNSVSTNKIQDGAVSNSKIGNNSVSTSKLATAAVNETKLASDSVTNAKIAPLAVDEPKIQTDSIVNRHLTNASVGINELQVVPCAYVVINHTQSIPHDTFTQVEWDEAKYDTGLEFGGSNMFTNNGLYLVARQRGIYLVESTILWEDGSVNGGVSGRRAKIRKNNVPVTGAGPVTTLKDDPSSPAAPFRVRLPMLSVVRAAEGDTFDVIVEQTSGGAEQIEPDGLNTHFSLTWLAPWPGL